MKKIGALLLDCGQTDCISTVTGLKPTNTRILTQKICTNILPVGLKSITSPMQLAEERRLAWLAQCQWTECVFRSGKAPPPEPPPLRAYQEDEAADDKNILCPACEGTLKKSKAAEVLLLYMSVKGAPHNMRAGRTTCLPDAADITDTKCGNVQCEKMIAKGEPRAALRGGTLLKIFIAAITDTEKELRKKRKL
ncbi:hypothetical protein JKP88DRAFT_274015 [Tribonema minus]|uniref:Uncharacterized protein n=1 Tax=Tribonema minus TaxID=303371 RepID=A0A836C9P3_9STRA|nr:hypothetical protein JKP88DRAFT_274015 [Tribonema minus]